MLARDGNICAQDGEVGLRIEAFEVAPFGIYCGKVGPRWIPLKDLDRDVEIP